MPKVTWARKPESKRLSAFFSSYMNLNGKTSKDLGKLWGKTPEMVRHEKTRPDRLWRVGDIIRWCNALKAPLEDALAEIK